MSQAHINFPSGVAMQFEAAGRTAATAVAPYRHAPGGSELLVLAYRLERLAERMRKRELVGLDAVDQALWACAGYLLSAQVQAEPIPVTARTIADEDEGAFE